MTIRSFSYIIGRSSYFVHYLEILRTSILKEEKTVNTKTNSTERSHIRVLLLFYDSIVLMMIWLSTLHALIHGRIRTRAWIINFILAYLCFLIARLILRVYHQVWRTGTIGVFLREIAADVLGSAAYLLIWRALGTKIAATKQIPPESAMTFCLYYIAATILMRIVYTLLYRFVKLDNPVSRALKTILTAVTLVDFDSKEEGGLMRLVLEPAVSETSPINEVQHVIDQFAIRGDVTSITQIKKGYINRTYRIETLSDTGHVHKYILQRINTNVFPDVDALMENFKLTTDHLHGKFLLPGHTKKGSVQMVRSTKDGRSYLRDDSGCWRVLTYFDDVYSLDIPDRPETFYYAGRAFGKFVKEMSDIDIEDIREVIPNFHNTRSRYENLEKSITLDPKGRVKDVRKEIEFVRARKDNFGIITDALESGRIPLRICHNDCNLNNILFDNETHLPVAIIDLDTVMPSSPLYDYGDSMRIGTNTATDDEKDLSKVSCDLALYERYARGYLEECGQMLTRAELELLPYASLVITSEDGIRFLMDHIDGDTYYNIYYPGQNLDRSRTQLALLADMEKKLPKIVRILKGIYSDLGLKADLDEKAPLWKR